MSTKPKSNAVLKNLPEERQAQIAEWCAKPNDRDADGNPAQGTGGLAFARAQLAADGLKVSLDTLSRFFSWWKLEQDLRLSFEVEDQVLASTGNALAAREAGENLLLRLGVARQDPRLIMAGAQTHDSRRLLDLQEQSGRTKAEHGAAKIAQKDRDFGLAREKFVVASCEKILKAAKDPATREVAESSSMTNEEKIAAIRKAYFAEIDAVQLELPE